MKDFTNEDIEYIKNNYSIKTVAEIAKYFNKSEATIRNVLRELKLIKQVHKPWTDEEIDFLKNYYDKMTSVEMSNKLQRTVNSINSKRKNLGLIENPNWTDDEIQYLKDHYLIETHGEIGKKLNRTKQAITAKCFDLDLYKKELPWSNQEIDFLLSNYTQITVNEISEILNRSPNAVKLKAERSGLKKSPYNCDYHFFDKIDTEEKAYWLGFISADGWISKNEKTGSGAVGIELQYADIEHLRKFNKSVNGNYRITDRWKKCNISNSNQSHHMCCIRIYSIVMYNSLLQYGISENKTHSIRIPELRDDLYRHFIRGFFDGDGCFCFSNNSFKVSFITASESMALDLQKILNEQGLHIRMYSYISEYGTTMYRPELDRNDEKISFLSWIYDDAKVYLNRKYKKYQKALQKYAVRDGLAA